MKDLSNKKLKLNEAENNRIIIIEYQLPREIKKYRKCLSYTLPFYATQIINPLLS